MNPKRKILNHIQILNQNLIYQVKFKIIHLKVKLINIIVNYLIQMKIITKAILIKIVF